MSNTTIALILSFFSLNTVIIETAMFVVLVLIASHFCMHYFDSVLDDFNISSIACAK